MQRTGQWETDGIFEPNWDIEKRLLSWGTLHMVPQALVQPRMVDLPYENWWVAAAIAWHLALFHWRCGFGFCIGQVIDPRN